MEPFLICPHVGDPLSWDYGEAFASSRSHPTGVRGGGVCGSLIKITSKRGSQIKRRRRHHRPPFVGVGHVAYPNVWFLTSNPL